MPFFKTVQLQEHDRIVDQLLFNLTTLGAFNWQSVEGNPHNQKKAFILHPGGTRLYPDVIAHSHKGTHIFEVEDAKGLNSRSVKQWVAYSECEAILHLIVPVKELAKAEALCKKAKVSARLGVYVENFIQVPVLPGLKAHIELDKKRI